MNWQRGSGRCWRDRLLSGAPALIWAAAVPASRLSPLPSLFHHLSETFSLWLFPLARLCFSAPVPPLLIAPYLPFSVLVSPFYSPHPTPIPPRPARELESISASDIEKCPASCTRAQFKSKTRFALPDSSLQVVINLCFLLFPPACINLEAN